MVFRHSHHLKWVCLDADSSDGIERLQDVWKTLDTQRISSILERSRRGGHLWVLFEQVEAQAARRLILGSLPHLQDVEVFPKQDRLTDSIRVGSLMRGPLGIHRLTGKRYPFLDPLSLLPVSRSVVGTLDFLAQVPKVNLNQVAQAKIFLYSEPGEDLSAPGRSFVKRPLSPIDKLKQRIGDPYIFISRFIDLDEQGKGHCPFHPPDTHPSFAVNREGGYWIDFHEINPRTGRYVGGDVVEFYRRLKNLSYKQVLAELRSQYPESGRSS
jgi:hypothetical protein